LNVVVKKLQAPKYNIHLWSQVDKTKTFSSEDVSFTPDADTIALFGAYITDSNSYEHHVEVISYSKYLDIVDKTRTGRITHIAYNYAHSGMTKTIYVYPTIGSGYYTDTLHYKAIRKLEDFDAVGNNPDFATYCTNALIWLTAEEIAPELNVDEEVWDRIVIKAKRELKMIQGNPEHEDSSFVEPSYENEYD
jgi:hypothetical protein